MLSLNHQNISLTISSLLELITNPFNENFTQSNELELFTVAKELMGKAKILIKDIKAFTSQVAHIDSISPELELHIDYLLGEIASLNSTLSNTEALLILEKAKSSLDNIKIYQLEKSLERAKKELSFSLEAIEWEEKRLLPKKEKFKLKLVKH